MPTGQLSRWFEVRWVRALHVRSGADEQLDIFSCHRSAYHVGSGWHSVDALPSSTQTVHRSAASA